jgi:hypothetical protein
MPGAVLNDLPQSVHIAGRKYAPGADHGVTVLLTAAGWILQRLPDQVIEEQRPELIRTLAHARDLTVEVRCSPGAVVRVRDGQRLLVEMPSERAAGRPQTSVVRSGRRERAGYRRGASTACKRP